jgi:hypothetical protein
MLKRRRLRQSIEHCMTSVLAIHCLRNAALRAMDTGCWPLLKEQMPSQPSFLKQALEDNGMPGSCELNRVLPTKVGDI